MKTVDTKLQPQRVKLIFNPGSGVNDESPLQIMAVVKEMQARQLIPELYLIEPDSNLQGSGR